MVPASLWRELAEDNLKAPEHDLTTTEGPIKTPLSWTRKLLQQENHIHCMATGLSQAMDDLGEAHGYHGGHEVLSCFRVPFQGQQVEIPQDQKSGELHSQP